MSVEMLNESWTYLDLRERDLVVVWFTQTVSSSRGTTHVTVMDMVSDSHY